MRARPQRRPGIHRPHPLPQRRPQARTPFGLAREPTRALAFVLARDLACNLDLARAGGLIVDLDLACHLASDLDRERALLAVRGIDPAMNKATLLYADVERVATAETDTRRKTRIRVAHSAKRIIDAAAQVLPVQHRGRYRDEFRSELYEVAAAKASRWDQTMYALRQFDRAWILRAELRQSVARRARS